MYSLAHYELKKQVYQGAMGTVYEAFDTKLERTVAIKILHNENLDGEMSAEALNEARFLARLNHPNIIQVFDCAEYKGQHYLVMEFCRGKNLLQYQKQHLLGLEQKLSVLIDIAKGLEHAHRNDIIHRDLKPSNILISDSGEVKVADFGIAEFIGSVDTTLASAGTRGYMSPEQIKGEALGHNSDWFSFCVLAIEFLTNQHPFSHHKPSNITKAICSGDYAEFDKLHTDMPVALTNILKQGLSLNANERVNVRRGGMAKQLIQVLQLLVQQAIMEQQTQPIDPPTHDQTQSNAQPQDVKQASTKKMPWLRYAVTACVFIGAVAAGSYYLKKYVFKAPVVAILPTHIDELSAEFSYHKSTLQGAVQSALWQQLTAQHTQLVSHAEMRMVTQGIDDLKTHNPKAYFDRLAQYTGAEVLVSSQVSCQQIHCAVEVARLAGPDWHVVDAKQWQASLSDTHGIHESVRFYVSALFDGLSTLDEEQQHQLHAQLFSYYGRYYEQGEISENTFYDVVALVKQEPNFGAGYTLVRELALQLHSIKGNRELVYVVNDLLDKAPRHYQQSTGFATNKALILLALGEADEALHYIEKIRAQGGAEGEYQNLKAAYYIEAGDLEHGRELLEQSLITRPNINVQMKLASLLYSMGDVSSSRALLNDIVTKLPNHGDAHQLLTVIALTNGDFDDVITRYESKLAESSDSQGVANASTATNLALAYMYSHKYNQAQKLAAKALALAPNNSAMTLNYADALTLSGMVYQAKEHYQRVVDINNGQDSAYSWSDRAQAFAHLGDYQQATVAIKEALDAGPELADIYYGAAIVYSEIGDQYSALYYAKKSIEAGYQSSWFYVPWFKPLCAHQQFTSLLEEPQRLCSVEH
ncbi:protein kinase domain-containing protein [Pseudoalteromonas sp. SSDWG2]|uniref:protein kinase domain-containing protein n=1 Tax=Pseudoalteromonas sp. SSDWG2 TaxID=3139391 RepID=UPI003BAB580F